MPHPWAWLRGCRDGRRRRVGAGGADPGRGADSRLIPRDKPLAPPGRGRSREARTGEGAARVCARNVAKPIDQRDLLAEIGRVCGGAGGEGGLGVGAATRFC